MSQSIIDTEVLKQNCLSFHGDIIMIEVNRNEIRTNIHDKVYYPRPIRSGGSS